MTATRVHEALTANEADVHAIEQAVEKTSAEFPNVAVINASTVITDAIIAAYVAALQVQVNEHFGPIWHTGCHLRQFKPGQAPANWWWLVVLDDSDMAGALGYHDVNPNGLPLGKVFARTDQSYGLQTSVTMSHELLEMLGDPLISLASVYQRGSAGRLFAYEACDAVESDSDGYTIGGVLVSDFVTPAWFTPGMPGPFDFRRLLTSALQLRPGGYIGYQDFNGGGWRQEMVAATVSPRAMHSTIRGTRRERRRRGAENWIRSTVPAEVGA